MCSCWTRRKPASKSAANARGVSQGAVDSELTTRLTRPAPLFFALTFIRAGAGRLLTAQHRGRLLPVSQLRLRSAVALCKRGGIILAPRLDCAQDLASGILHAHHGRLHGRPKMPWRPAKVANAGRLASASQDEGRLADCMHPVVSLPVCQLHAPRDDSPVKKRL